MINPYGSWLADGAVPPVGPVADQWFWVDLGAEFDIRTLRLWNYHENAATNGRSVHDYELFVASNGATTPLGFSPSVPNPENPITTPFKAGGGWTSVSSGVLAQVPLSNPPLIVPTDVFDLTGTNNVRYIGLDIESNYDGGTFVGFGHIQVFDTVEPPVVPEPGGLALMVLAGLMAAGFRRVAPLRR